MLGRSSAARPNVILIMTDDQGYGDLSLHANPHLSTPNLDSLARQSVEFTRFYVSPVCAPTRSSLLTGRYNVRCGVHGVTGGRETMPVDEVTLAEAFRASGYRTALFGKWHLGEHYPYVPHAQGFEEFIGFRTGHWMNYFDTELERNGKPYPTKGYITDALTNESIRFLEANRRRPFFLYLAYNAPHSPFQAPERYFRPFERKGLPGETAAVYAMVSNLDENIGRLLGRLDRLQLAENTIVIFLTDNGPNGQRYNAGLRAAKGSVYEGGVRVPFFIRWPGSWKDGRRVETIAAHIDVYPTLLEACDVAAPKGRPVDGMSLLPLIQGDTRGWPDRMLFTHREGNADPAAMYPGTVRTQRYNLVNGKELYDVTEDPGERNDVSAAHPEIARKLNAAYEGWYRDAIAERGFRRFPIQVGHPEENPVILAAPQSYFHGDLKFHGGPGYAHDWIINWTSVDRHVHWDIEVVTPGQYDVSLRYLCQASDAGARIAIEAGGSAATAAIEAPTPMERKPSRAIVPETTYPEMHWGTLKLGKLRLHSGRSQLAVKALTKPGNEAMQLKEVVLQRTD